MKHNFEILPNGSAVRLRVWGADIKELFSAALRGAAFYLKPDILDLKKAELKEWKKVKAVGVDLASLLVEFLSAVIAESDNHNTVFTHVVFEKFEENFLDGKIFGRRVEGFDREIRAVSYEELDIRKNQETGMYETILVFDA